MRISLEDYFRAYADHPEITPEIEHAAARMLDKVNALLTTALAEGVPLRVNPATGTLVSGQDNGGWRPRACPIGAPKSNHKIGRAVDVYDPDGALDAWLDDERLMAFGLAREHPEATERWCHLQDVLPKSGRRTFWP
jgi:hypothetical protein